MLTKGEVNVSWKEKVEEDVKWFDTIDFSKLKTPPHLGKNAKGWRFDFSSYENLHQKALTIWQKNSWDYKNLNDVYKDAHYIGMYILEKIVADRPRYKVFDDILAASINRDRESSIKSFARERFMKSFEEFSSGIINEECLLEIAESIKNALPEHMKGWFEEDCEATLESDYETRRVQGVVKQRKYREKIREAKERNIHVM
jgi:hypothetical protein